MVSASKKIIVIIVAAALVAAGTGMGVWFFMHKNFDERVISRIVKTPEGKGYLEVDGKPFIFGYVENWGVQQIYGDTGGYRFNTEPFDEPLPFEWMENVFEKTAFLGYKTIAPFLRWNDIEPSAQGVYDWTTLDSYVDWAVKYDLRIDIVWMGTIHCGGARLRGENNGWMSWIPDYLQDKDKYFGKGIYDTDIFLAYVPDGGPNDADARFLHQCERDAVAAMMAHLAEYDKTHRVITFQVNNESNFSPYYRENKQAILDVLNELGKVVKTSDYSVMTRINLTGSEHDPDLNALEYIDCNGVDPYSYNIEVISRIAGQSDKSHMPHIAENGAYYDNTSSLMVAALAAGGFYSTYHINDHFGKFGFFNGDVVPYVDWKIGEIPARRHSGYDVRNLNLSLYKAEALVATSPKEKMTGLNIDTDLPIAHYDDFVYFLGYEIGMDCADGSVGLLIENDGYIYLITDTSAQVSLKTRLQPEMAEAGRFDAGNVWVTERSPEIVKGDDGIFRLDARSQEIVRIRLPEVQGPDQSSSGQGPSVVFVDDFENGTGPWDFDDGDWQIVEGETSKVIRQSDNMVEASAYAGDPKWKNYTVSADFRVESGYGSLLGRIDERGDMYILEIRAKSVKLVKWMNGQFKNLTMADHPFESGRWYTASLSFSGSRIEMRIDGELKGEVIYDASVEQGSIGIRTSFGVFEFDNVIVESN